MFKKSSSNSRDNKKSNSSFKKKDDSRGSSYGKKPYSKEGGSSDDSRERPRKPYGQSDGSGGGFRKEGGGAKPFRPGGPFGDNDRSERRPGKPGDRSGRPSSGFRKNDSDSSDRKPFNRSNDRDSPSGKRPYTGRDDRSSDAPRKPFREGGGGAPKRPYSGRPEGSSDSRPDRKPFDRDNSRNDRGSSSEGKRPFSDRRETGDRDGKPFRRADSGDAPKRPFTPRRDDSNNEERDGKRPFADRRSGSDNSRPPRAGGRPERNDDRESRPAKRPFAHKPETTGDKEEVKRETPADFYKKKSTPYTTAEERYLEDDDAEWEFVEEKKKKKSAVEAAASFPMPLNKFIAHSGECSRRDAAELVRQGKAKVNGELITDPGHKINQEDKVTLSGKKLIPQKGMVYILLNKPKGFITTTDDPQGRRTVMDLVKNADAGRLYPVGRLDRATTGLILITNDGNLAQRMAHPTHKTKKVYHVTLDKPLTQPDFDKIMAGMELEDGKAIVDEMAYLEKKTELGLEIHSGKNRIVRRIFETLGYEVEKLDRVMYAGLTKKNLPRSKWRFLDEREIVLLKHFKS